MRRGYVHGEGTGYIASMEDGMRLLLDVTLKSCEAAVVDLNHVVMVQQLTGRRVDEVPGARLFLTSGETVDVQDEYRKVLACWAMGSHKKSE